MYHTLQVSLNKNRDYTVFKIQDTQEDINSTMCLYIQCVYSTVCRDSLRKLAVTWFKGGLVDPIKSPSCYF